MTNDREQTEGSAAKRGRRMPKVMRGQRRSGMRKKWRERQSQGENGREPEISVRTVYGRPLLE